MDARQAGFTLIEITVALAILAMFLALTMPAMSRFYDRISFSLAREDVEREIGGLGTKARQTGRNLSLKTWPATDGSGTGPLIALPKGWRIEADPPIEYRFDGLCLGGRLSIFVDQERFDYRLSPPFCRPVPAQ